VLVIFLARRGPLLLLTLLALALLVACREERAEPTDFVPQPRTTSGDPRSFLLGFSSIPGELTEEAYLGTYDLAANNGEALLIQRPPAWEDFLPGASVSQALRDQTLAEQRAAELRGLQLVYVLDVFDPSARERLQALPATHAGLTLEDEELRQALRADALFVARNVQPAYLVIGHEVNVTFEHSPDAYQQFVEIYSEIYDALAEAAPEVRVLTSFQYEELLGVIPWLPPHAPRWELFEDFEGRLDVLGITSYPSFAFAVARKVAPLYYRQIRDYTDLPIAFVSTGYASGAGREGINASTPAEQRRYLQRLFEDADRLGSPLLIWLLARDLSYATGPPEDLVASLGLMDVDGAPKEAWPAWEEAAARPYDPTEAEQARLTRIEAEAEAEASSATATAQPSGN
jgi:hypothetical protein